MFKKFFWQLCAILLISLFSVACGVKQRQPAQPPAPQTILDLQNFPQNLLDYANQDSPDHRLMSAESQQRAAKRFEDIYFGPWQMKKTTVRKKDIAGLLKRPRGYKNDSEKWTEYEWESFRKNAALETFPSRALAAITVRQTNLREIPTHKYMTDKTGVTLNDYPFDYFQYSLLAPGMPVLVAHTSRDGRWHFIECPIASGWVDARDIAFADENFRSAYRTGYYAAITSEDIPLPATDINASIGAIFPVSAKNKISTTSVLIPVKNANGMAKLKSIHLPAESCDLLPMPLTPKNVAIIGNRMMGQKYGWGGTLGLRDCSALMRDLFTPFGIWLPRNSGVQAKRGNVIRLSGLSEAQKNSLIMEEGVPFLSLIGLNGHIGLYVGRWKGKAAIFHNAWGVRVVKDGNDNERYVIGKTVVTSISPGKELPNLYTVKTFSDRVRTLTIMGEKAN